MQSSAFQVAYWAPLNGLKQTRSICVNRTTPHCAAQPPRRIAAVARDMQGALQDALRARVSRAAVELPSGARLGTEKRDDSTSRAAGDRELCRILAAMFEGTELSVHALFSSSGLANAAKKAWGPLIECTVGTWDEIGGKSSPRKRSGFGKPAGNVQFGDGVDVLLVVAPTAAQMRKVRLLAEQWGMDKLIILLNCNIEKGKAPVDLTKYLREEFENVYVYRPNPHPKWSGGVLFRKFPDDWVLCRQPPVGFLKEILSKESQPSLEEIETALKDEGQGPTTGLIKKLSSFLGES